MDQGLPIIIVTPPLPSVDDLPEVMRLALESILTGSPMVPTAPVVDAVAGDASATPNTPSTPTLPTFPRNEHIRFDENTAPEDVYLGPAYSARTVARAADPNLALVVRRPRTVQRSASRRFGRVFSDEGMPLPTPMSAVPFVGKTGIPAAHGMGGMRKSKWRGGLGSLGLKINLVARTVLGIRQ